MAAHLGGYDANGCGVSAGEVLWGLEGSGDEVFVFLDVGGKLVGRRVLLSGDAGLADDDDDVATTSVAVEVERDVGVVGDVVEALCVEQIVDEDLIVVPEEPDGVGLWCTVFGNGGEPDDGIFAQAACDALAKWRSGVWEDSAHRVGDLLQAVSGVPGCP